MWSLQEFYIDYYYLPNKFFKIKLNKQPLNFIWYNYLFEQNSILTLNKNYSLKVL